MPLHLNSVYLLSSVAVVVVVLVLMLVAVHEIVDTSSVMANHISDVVVECLVMLILVLVVNACDWCSQRGDEAILMSTVLLGCSR